MYTDLTAGVNYAPPQQTRDTATPKTPTTAAPKHAIAS